MSNLLGIWFFTALIHNGQIIPPPNPDLKLYYTFNSQTQNEIYYYRTNEDGFCRRSANYSADETTITQTIVDVDRENRADCAQDPDMQLGANSVVNYKIVNDQLYLYLPLGDDELVYIFSKTN